MKKITAILLAIVLCIALPLSALADAPEETGEENTITVYVTLSDAGELATAMALVSVTDKDGDGALSINDALICAHEIYCDEGAAGYITYTSEYGLSISKLWGVENGGSYMYYLNNKYVNGLNEPISQGDYIAAYGFKDLEGWSDVYTYFELPFISGNALEPIELTAMVYDYALDPDGGASPFAGAKITIDNNETNYVTDENGKVRLTFSETGIYMISASSDNYVIVPPVCAVTVFFSDVAEKAWYYPAVKYASDRGFMVGVNASDFKPESQMTIAQYMTVMYRLGVSVGALEAGLETEGDNWQQGAEFINNDSGLKLKNLGAPINRGEIAAVTAYLLRKADVPQNAGLSDGFTDTASAVYADEINYVRAAGVIDGYEDGSFRPENSVKRSEASQVIYKILLALKK